MIGKVIKHYRIDSLIGDGGMGAVYRGTDLNLNRPVALKVLHAQLMRDPDLRERFKEEARIQARLNHPNIVTVYAFDAESGAIVMELVPGRGLNEVIEMEGGPIPYHRCLEIFGQVLLAMSYAHAFRDEFVGNGIVHRDLKPSNILIVPSGSQELAKITDFGIAKIVGDARNRTATGIMMGTLRYMPPEQIKSARDVGPPSDIYSLGVTLYQMVTGQVPFNADTEYEIMNRIMTAEPTLPSRLAGGIAPDLERVILKAMAKNPEERFQTCDEFLNALAEAGGKDRSKLFSMPIPLPSPLTLSPRPAPAPDATFRTVPVGSMPMISPPGTSTPAYSLWQELQPTLKTVYDKLAPALTFAHHNIYLLFILISLLSGVMIRFADREPAVTLAHAFLYLLPFFIVSQGIKPDPTWKGFARLTSIIPIPYFTVFLLGLVEGGLDSDRIKSRLDLLKMTGLMGITIFATALLVLKILAQEVIARFPPSTRHAWSSPDASLAQRLADIKSGLLGLDRNRLFWRIFLALLLAAAGAAFFRVIYQGENVKTYCAIILGFYVLLDCMIAAKPLAGVSRITLLVLVYFLASLAGLKIGDDLDKETFYRFFKFAVEVEIIFALPGLIIAVLARNLRIKPQTPGVG